MSGVPDLPENDHKVTYPLSEKDGKTEVTILMDNNASKKEKMHSEANWETVLQGLKNPWRSNVKALKAENLQGFYIEMTVTSFLIV